MYSLQMYCNKNFLSVRLHRQAILGGELVGFGERMRQLISLNSRQLSTLDGRSRKLVDS